MTKKTNVTNVSLTSHKTYFLNKKFVTSSQRSIVL